MVFCAIIFGFCYGLYCWEKTLKINKVYYIFTLILKPFIWLGYKKLNINNSSISPAIQRERSINFPIDFGKNGDIKSKS